jgi:hypothetical protein
MMGNYDWHRWLALREASDEMMGPEGTLKFNRTKEGIANDHDKIKDDLFRAVWDKYSQDARQFFDSIAQRDPEVRALLKQLDSSRRPSEFEEPKHPSEIDEFEPPISDRGSADDGMEGEGM